MKCCVSVVGCHLVVTVCVLLSCNPSLSITRLSSGRTLTYPSYSLVWLQCRTSVPLLVTGWLTVCVYCSVNVQQHFICLRWTDSRNVTPASESLDPVNMSSVGSSSCLFFRSFLIIFGLFVIIHNFAFLGCSLIAFHLVIILLPLTGCRLQPAH